MGKQKNKNWLWIVLIGGVILLTVAILFMGKRDPKGTKVTAEAAAPRTIVEVVSASGRIYPETEVNISSDVSGELVELYVKEGDSVVAGQLLAKVNPETYISSVERAEASVSASKAQLAGSKSQIAQLEAQYAQVQAQYDNAKQAFDRSKKLLEQGVVSQSDFEAAETNLRTAKANLEATRASVEAARQSAKSAEFTVESAQATVKESRENLRRTSIFATQSGIISRLNVEKGERVVGNQMMSGTEIMRIANMTFMEVQVDVTENDVLRVNIGDEVAVEVDAYLDRKFKGIVRQIANSATTNATGALSTDQVTNFTVKIRLLPQSYRDLVNPQKPYPFRPGMSATVEIKTDELPNVLSIPITAVTTREGEQAKEAKSVKEVVLKEIVFVCTPADTVKMVEIKTGSQDDAYIQVVEGLQKGEEVVTGPYTMVSKKLKQGDKILKVTEDELYDKKPAATKPKE